MTLGQRWRLRRNLAIYDLWSTLHWSQRMLADVFDLPRSRIASILTEMHALGEAHRESDRSEIVVPRMVRNGLGRRIGGKNVRDVSRTGM